MLVLASDITDTGGNPVYLDDADIYPDMDPRLQQALDRRGRGWRTVATASSGSDEIGVVALVEDVAGWVARSDVRPGAVAARWTAAGWSPPGCRCPGWSGSAGRTASAA